MLQRFVIILLFVFCVVLVLFPVLLGGLLLTQAAGDTLGALVFRGILVANLSVLGATILLLVGTLAAVVVNMPKNMPKSDREETGEF